jgi:hypothetical protein
LKKLMKLKRIVFILLFGLGLMAATAAFLLFQFARPVGTGAAGPVIAREPFGQPWITRPVRVVGLGDSVTAGFGARKGYSYFDRLIKNPADESPDFPKSTTQSKHSITPLMSCA